MNIGIALSGGGFRATVFHLGVLARLSAEQMLENVSFLSTVSGGSLSVGLIFAANDFRWPSSHAYREVVVPHAKKLLTNYDLESSLIWKVLRDPRWLLRGRADYVAELLRRHWGIDCRLNELDGKPRWIINATCYETGRVWRMEGKRMGDYRFGYVLNPDLPLASAMAASAGLPVLIGPLVLDARQYSWVKYVEGSHVPSTPIYSKIHLWDGGLYDNLGVESLYKIGTGFRTGIDFLVVSDGSGNLGLERYQTGLPALRRLIDISNSQIRALRARSLVHHFSEGRPGVYLQIGNTSKYILEQGGCPSEVVERLAKETLDESDVSWAKQLKTTIRSLSALEFDMLFRHGFEVTDHTLHAYKRHQFELHPYNGWLASK